MIAAALTVAFLGVLAFAGFVLWLKQPYKLIEALKTENAKLAIDNAHTRRELDTACSQWANKFAAFEKRTDANDKSIERLERTAGKTSPLGKRYDART